MTTNEQFMELHVADKRARYKAALAKAHAHSWDQQWDEAIRYFNLAIQESPQEPAAYAGLGLAYLELNQLERALHYYKQAARQAQGDVATMRPVAEMQERLGQYGPAAQSYVALGEAYLKQRQTEEALDNWRRAIGLDATLLAARQRLASLYQKQGNRRAAVRELLAIAHLLQMKGDQEKALRACDAALQLEPQNADALEVKRAIEDGRQPPALSFQLSASTHASALTPQPSALGLLAQARQQAVEELAQAHLADVEGGSDSGLADNGRRDGRERNTLISQGLDCQAQGQMDEAIDCYRRAILSGLNSAAAHFNLGALYLDQARWDDARREFERAARDPAYAVAGHTAAGETQRQCGRVEEAARHLLTAMKTADVALADHSHAGPLAYHYETLSHNLHTQPPGEVAALMNQVARFFGQEAWQERGRQARARLDALAFDDQVLTLVEVVAVGSYQALESLRLGQEYAKQGLLNSAVEETFRAIQLAPHYLPSHWLLGDLLARQGQGQMAALKFRTLADIHVARGDSQSAKECLARAADLAPFDLALRERLIEMLHSQGQIDPTLEQYLALGEAYYQLAQTDRARETYQAGLKLATERAADRQWRARFLRLMADLDRQRLDWKQAVVAYQELRQEEPDDERVALNLIDLYYKIGQPQEALRELDAFLFQMVRSGRGEHVPPLLEEMIDRRPTDPGLVDRLLRLYIQQKQRPAAINLLDRVGRVQLEAGETEQAAATITRLLKLGPANPGPYEALLKQLQQVKRET